MFKLEDVNGQFLWNTNFCQSTLCYIFIESAGESSDLLNRIP